MGSVRTLMTPPTAVLTAPPPQLRWRGGRAPQQERQRHPHRTRLNPAALFRISPHGRPIADRRFRFPGHPADRPPPARSRGLLRNPSLPVGRPGHAEAVRPQGDRAVGRPGLGDRGPAPAADPAIFAANVPMLGICYGEQTMAQQLGGTVEAGHHREFGRAELEVKKPSALFDGVWQPGDRKQVWMSHGDRVTKLPPGFSVIATSGERALRRDRRRGAQVLRRAVPSRGDAHARRRQASAQLRAQDRGLQGRLDDGRLQGPRHRPGPRPGRQGQGDLRPLRRRRLLGGGRAAARGDRRPAAVRVRRPRPAAAGRGRARSCACSATTTTSRWSMPTRRSCS